MKENEIQRIIHPVHGLKISQTAYIAEFLTDRIITFEELYEECADVFPNIDKQNFRVLVQKVKEQLGIKKLILSKQKKEKLRTYFKMEKRRVLILQRQGKFGIIELKKL